MNEYLALLQILGPLVARAYDAYNKARELAAQNGVSEADLTAADARFLKHYDDPLAGEPPVVNPGPVSGDPTTAEYDTQAEATKHATAENPNVIKKKNGKFGVWPQMQLPPGAVIVYTKP